jgi:hypothetical protein
MVGGVFDFDGFALILSIPNFFIPNTFPNVLTFGPLLIAASVMLAMPASSRNGIPIMFAMSGFSYDTTAEQTFPPKGALLKGQHKTLCSHRSDAHQRRSWSHGRGGGFQL